MGKLKLMIVFVAAAIVSGSVTLAPKVHAYWKQVHAVSCAPYQFGFGFNGPFPGDLSIDSWGVANTTEKQIDLICPALTDDRTFPAESTTGWPTPIIHAKFSRWYPASQNPRVQACGFYGCTWWYYGDESLNSWATVYVDVYGGPWRPESYNTVVIGLDPMYLDWGRMMIFQGLTVGSEKGPDWPPPCTGEGC